MSSGYTPIVDAWEGASLEDQMATQDPKEKFSMNKSTNCQKYFSATEKSGGLA